MTELSTAMSEISRALTDRKIKYSADHDIVTLDRLSFERYKISQGPYEVYVLTKLIRFLGEQIRHLGLVIFFDGPCQLKIGTEYPWEAA